MVCVMIINLHLHLCFPSQDEDDEEPLDDLRRYVVDVKSMVVTSAFALGAGFLGGMLGLGGGTIISPLLIEMGMHPQVKINSLSLLLKREPILRFIIYVLKLIIIVLWREGLRETWCMTKNLGAFQC